MENRAQVVKDYLTLRLALNRTNLLQNQKNQIVFKIVKLRQFAYQLNATLNIQGGTYIVLCEKQEQRIWASAGYPGLNYLDDFCADFLSKNFSDSNSDHCLQNLKKELETLGIPQK